MTISYLSNGRVFWKRWRKVMIKMTGYDWRGRRLKVNARWRGMP